MKHHCTHLLFSLLILRVSKVTASPKQNQRVLMGVHLHIDQANLSLHLQVKFLKLTKLMREQHCIYKAHGISHALTRPQ